MGTHFTFSCSTCGYEAEVSGGKDRGKRATTRTMTCFECRELVDVLTGAYGREGATGEPEIDDDLGRCPACERRHVEVWPPDARPCPRCGSRMRKGAATVCWD